MSILISSDLPIGTCLVRGDDCDVIAKVDQLTHGPGNIWATTDKGVEHLDEVSFIGANLLLKSVDGDWSLLSADDLERIRR